VPVYGVVFTDKLFVTFNVMLSTLFTIIVGYKTAVFIPYKSLALKPSSKMREERNDVKSCPI